MKLSLTYKILFLGLMFFAPLARAQNNVTLPHEKLPYIDRDADGINDVFQYKWGERLITHYKNHQSENSQSNFNNADDKDKKSQNRIRWILTNMTQNGLVDVNGDGRWDMTVQEYLRRHYKGFDINGDGRPDAGSLERILKYLRERREWMKEVRINIRHNLPPFPDKNSDGIPDNLPEGFWRGINNGRP